MAAGSELLDDVFFNAEVDERAVSDVVGSLESQLTGSGRGKLAGRLQTAGVRVGVSAAGNSSEIRDDNNTGPGQENRRTGEFFCSFIVVLLLLCCCLRPVFYPLPVLGGLELPKVHRSRVSAFISTSYQSGVCGKLRSSRCFCCHFSRKPTTKSTLRAPQRAQTCVIVLSECCVSRCCIPASQ